MVFKFNDKILSVKLIRSKSFVLWIRSTCMHDIKTTKKNAKITLKKKKKKSSAFFYVHLHSCMSSWSVRQICFGWPGMPRSQLIYTSHICIIYIQGLFDQKLVARQGSYPLKSLSAPHLILAVCVLRSILRTRV
jgi:hypothetical protein